MLPATDLPPMLDGRLSLLEDLLGLRSLLQAAWTAGGGEVSLPPPLLVTIAKLEHQLSLLTQPRHLDSISRRVKVIVTAASSPTPGPSPLPSPAGSPSSPATKLLCPLPRPHQRPRRHRPCAPLLPLDALHKLDRLYSLLPRLEPLLPLVPHLLSRLRSLTHLHASADSFHARLDDALNGLRATSDRTAYLSKLLSTIQNNANANHSLVDQRIDGLLLALDRLKPS
ncbi:hypothetical protein PtB15_7B371 [Puccinia triticina]|nr:hypothetical protein PtB15_7B371 [Puccinia triticina]